MRFKCAHKNHLLILIIALLPLVCCNREEEESIPIEQKYYTELVSVESDNHKLILRTDDNEKLIPQSLSDELLFSFGNRMIVKFAYLEEKEEASDTGRSIRILHCQPVFLGKINTDKALHDSINQLKEEPVTLERIWVTGHFINMGLKINYYDQTHYIFMNESSYDTTQQNHLLKLRFVHCNPNDRNGTSSKTFLSYDISNYLVAEKTLDIQLEVLEKDSILHIYERSIIF